MAKGWLSKSYIYENEERVMDKSYNYLYSIITFG